MRVMYTADVIGIRSMLVAACLDEVGDFYQRMDLERSLLDAMVLVVMFADLKARV
ncbi:hypothetical protein LPH50_06395 [Xylella taiwanensis]|nr:hypothetical protein [Xylella taiwanensis]UFN08159.1 hypothetical protein LPH45_06285 [Xylella taiwanensis]UFN15053.1 hypothetical protein LPH50_06395 [Xylella taiwanensis]UFN26289.1 hypothetical protein LPH51_06485 [Xylella taiwanensis]UFN32992.1 hypothetical protein LPH40_06240 [Xylella taiwanensis]